MDEQDDASFWTLPLVDLGEGIGADFFMEKNPDALPYVGLNRRRVGYVSVDRDELIVRANHR